MLLVCSSFFYKNNHHFSLSSIKNPRHIIILKPLSPNLSLTFTYLKCLDFSPSPWTKILHSFCILQKLKLHTNNLRCPKSKLVNLKRTQTYLNQYIATILITRKPILSPLQINLCNSDIFNYIISILYIY